MLNSSSSDAVLNLVLAMLLYNGVETVTDITGTSPQLKSLLQRCYDVCVQRRKNNRTRNWEMRRLHLLTKLMNWSRKCSVWAQWPNRFVC